MARRALGAIEAVSALPHTTWRWNPTSKKEVGMKTRWRVVLIALALTANVAIPAPEDRFKGGSCDGYACSTLLDAPIRMPSGTMLILR